MEKTVKQKAKNKSGKLLKYVIKEDGKVLMELLPSVANEKKSREYGAYGRD